MLADETTDVSQTKQFSLCVCHVDPTTSRIGEDFLCFIPVDEVSASSLADTLKRQLLNLDLPLNMMRRQEYDGAAAMSWAIQRRAGAHSERLPNGVVHALLVALPEPLFERRLSCPRHSTSLSHN
ncbi:hypothetical protein HPB49_009446 [Dermacentor silvarum]|uniref:Uncharacterized protein n=1 Tax=Dermacentor silvarum TaxID=543639 RepID=A0ACB8CEE9_DERSI|nr:hypothetical protein HPB49_009446 [Dermacentor silvarum]